MSRVVVFKTPGHIPMESFITFGINSKPNSLNPIGFFGSGLKYAVSVLVREGIEISVWVGMTEHRFSMTRDKFRDKEFSFIHMGVHANVWYEKVLKTVYHGSKPLPYTTEFGKTWKLWQAFRELESNTRDENGETFVADSFGLDDVRKGSLNTTHIVVKGESFVQEYYERHKTFLPEGLRERNSTDRLQVLDKPGGAIYYRGIRVLDLEGDRKSKFTYNILQQMELTEDRTLKNVHEAERIIAEHISQSEDKKLVAKALDGKASLESNLPYDWGYNAPSETFSTYSERPTAPPRARTLSGYFVPKAPPIDWRALFVQFITVMKDQWLDWGYLDTCKVHMHPNEYKLIVELSLAASPHNEAIQAIAKELGINFEPEIPF